MSHWERLAATPGSELGAYRVYCAKMLVEEKKWRDSLKELALVSELPLTADQRFSRLTLQSEVYRQTDRLRESIALLEQAIKVNPNSPQV